MILIAAPIQSKTKSSYYSLLISSSNGMQENPQLQKNHKVLYVPAKQNYTTPSSLICTFAFPLVNNLQARTSTTALRHNHVTMILLDTARLTRPWIVYKEHKQKTTSEQAIKLKWVKVIYSLPPSLSQERDTRFEKALLLAATKQLISTDPRANSPTQAEVQGPRRQAFWSRRRPRLPSQ